MNDATTPPVSPADQQSMDEFLGAPPARPWYRNPRYIVGAVAIIALLLLLARCFGGSAVAGYATQDVRRDNLTVTVSATGNLLPTNEVEVGSEQSGLVNDVFVDNNDRVKRGQPLARLDTSRLRDTIVQNQAALAAAQAQVAQAQASAVQARANLARLEDVYRVSGGKVPSHTELDTGRAENQRQQAAVRAAQAQVMQTRAQLASAQTNLAKATIYSPVTGVVLSRKVDPGQTVAASFQAPVLFTIAEDLSRMKLEVKVDEADVGQVHEGQRAAFTVDAYPGRTFTARITRVDVGANATSTTGTTSASATVVAYTAVLSVDNSQLLLRPGMTATADIVTSEKRNVLLVPNAALRFSPDRDAAAASGQQSGVTSVLVPRPMRRGSRQPREVTIGRGSTKTVYVLGADGNPKPVVVVVGASNGSLTEIVSGALKPGDKIITGRLAGASESGSSGSGQSRSGASGRQRSGSPAGPAALLVPPIALRRRRGERAHG